MCTIAWTPNNSLKVKVEQHMHNTKYCHSSILIVKTAEKKRLQIQNIIIPFLVMVRHVYLFALRYIYFKTIQENDLFILK